MSERGILQQLDSIELALCSAPGYQRGDNLSRSDSWMRSVVKGLDEALVPESGYVMVRRAWIQLLAAGPLARKENGDNLPYLERVEQARRLQEDIVSVLKEAKSRMNSRYLRYAQIAQSAIRVSAASNILAAPGSSPRNIWLVDMIRRMSKQPDSAPYMIILSLSMTREEMRTLVDQVFLSAFGV